MSIKERIQNVLHVYLDDEQVEYIKEYWKAFYNAPEEYSDDIVTDMILQDLELAPIEEWSDNKKEEIKMDIEISLLGVTGLSNMHYSPCGTLAWGRIIDEAVYYRMVSQDLLPVVFSDGLPVTFADAGNLSDGHVDITFIFKDETEYCMLVLNSESCVRLGGLRVTDYMPSNWEYVGATILGTGVEDSNLERLKLTQAVYVPFNKGSRDSRIPIMWAIEKGQAVGYGCQVPTEDFNHILSDSWADMEYLSKVARYIENSLPPIDLEVDRKDKRYAVVTVVTENGVQEFMYNRNNIAYNGKSSDIVGLMSVLLYRMSFNFDDIVETSIDEFMKGQLDIELVYVKLKGALVNKDESVSTETEKEEVKPEEKEHLKSSDNPLIRAAQKVDVRYD